MMYYSDLTMFQDLRNELSTIKIYRPDGSGYEKINSQKVEYSFTLTFVSAGIKCALQYFAW